MVTVSHLCRGWGFEPPNRGLKRRGIGPKGVIASDGMSEALAASLQLEVDALDPVQIVDLPKVLAAIPMWSSDHLVLTEAILERASALDVAEDVLDALRRGAPLRHWSGSNGISPELDAAYASAARAAEATADQRLKPLFTSFAEQFDASRRDVQRRDRDDDDDDDDE